MASNVLSDVLKQYNYKNLDEIFPNDNTTTEFMCRVIHRDLCRHIKSSSSYRGGLKVTLHESHRAWASYTDYL